MMSCLYNATKNTTKTHWGRSQETFSSKIYFEPSIQELVSMLRCCLLKAPGRNPVAPHIQVSGFIAKLLSFNPTPPSAFQAARYHPLPPSQERREGRLVSPLLTDGVIPQDTLDRLINKSGRGRGGRKRTLLPASLGFLFFSDNSVTTH